MTARAMAWLVWVGVLLAPPGSAAETVSRGALLQRIDAAVGEAMQRDQVPGVSLAIQRGGELLLAKGYGYADLENAVPATEHSVYRIGSVTKQFTAAAILALAEQGRLSLDDPIDELVPGFQTHGFRIRVAQLLDHTAGIKGYTEMPAFWEQSRQDLSHEQMLELIGSAPFEFEPGERFQYSNSAYYLAGLVIEKVSGRSYAEFLAETFFEPLGLRETRYLDEAPIVPGRVRGYAVDGESVVNSEPLSMRLPFSAGSLGSSALDLLAWQRALTAGRVVSRASFQRMTTPATLTDGEPTHYGLGLSLSQLDGHRKVGHGGGINGFLTQVSWYPDDELFIVLLCNSTSARPQALENRLARLTLGLSEPVLQPVALSQAELARYVGRYDPGRSPLPVTLEAGALHFAGQRLLPLGDHRFAGDGDPDLRLHFELEGERVVLVRIEREGSASVARRVE